jgi:hypothetical protein
VVGSAGIAQKRFLLIGFKFRGSVKSSLTFSELSPCSIVPLPELTSEPRWELPGGPRKIVTSSIVNLYAQNNILLVHCALARAGGLNFTNTCFDRGTFRLFRVHCL